MPFAPGDPWPSTTPGGVVAARWGGYMKLWVLAEIAPGIVMHVGPMSDGSDLLDAGNVVGDAGLIAGGGPTTDPDGGLPVTTGLWVDLTCDLTEVDISGGAQTSAGMLSKVEAGTLEATLWDPTGKYDPHNPDTPFALGGRSRLRAGVRVKAFCETVVDPTVVTPTVITRQLFTGTADSWAEDWSKEPGDRFAKLVASDAVKDLTRLNRAEQPPVGAGDQVFTRLARIATYFGFSSPTAFGALSTRTLQSTTLAQSAWELLNRAVDDDLGFLYVRGDGGLIYQSDANWQVGIPGTPQITVGNNDPGAYDIVTDATPASIDKDQINTVTAARSGGTEQSYAVAASVTEFGELSYKRTDLGLETDLLALAWAQRLASLSAYPHRATDDITMVPAVAPDSWRAFALILDMIPVLTVIQLKFRTPRFGYVIDELVRMVGWRYTITADQWSVTWRTVAASMAAGGNVFTVGPHAFDRLDAGNIIG